MRKLNMKLRRFPALALCLTLLLCLAAPATAVDADTFSDIPAAHWANAYVTRAAEHGLVGGYGDGRYGVDDSVKYSEWCKMLVGLLYPDYLESAISSGMSAEPWWNPYVQIAAITWALDDTEAIAGYDTGKKWTEEIVSAEISRYDMAMTIYNTATRNEWESGDAASVTASIADWASIPAKYQEAVKYCYASGFITGIDSEGTFGGGSGMTRGQAATVLCRLLNVVEGMHDFNTAQAEDTSSETALSVADRITITDTSLPRGYDYRVQVSGDHIAGKLANGKAITEDNILAMLAELEAIFPEDTSWGDGENGDHYRYDSKSPAPNGGGCNAFAGMVCDVLYGHGATYSTHNDLSAVKCGDIVWLYNENIGNEHWIVVNAVSIDSDGFRKFNSSEGNVNGRIKWRFPNSVAYTESLYPNSTVYSFF